MTTAPDHTTCNAMTKEGSKLHICEREHKHKSSHKDGEYYWYDTLWDRPEPAW